jgi:hypothetical protein
VTLDRPEAIAQMARMRVPMHVPVVLSQVEVAGCSLRSPPTSSARW